MSNPQSSSANGGIGGKLKGAVQVIHGSGEMLRGSILGAADRIGGSSKNRSDFVDPRSEATAQQGQNELDAGLANYRHLSTTAGPGPAQTGAGPNAATANNTTAGTTTGAAGTGPSMAAAGTGAVPEGQVAQPAGTAMPTGTNNSANVAGTRNVTQ